MISLGVSLLVLLASVGGGTNAAEPMVADSPRTVAPLLIGAEVPPLTLRTADGKPFDLGAALAAKPSILILYRGGW